MATEIPSVFEHEGYIGHFTRHEALGAWRNGTRIEKVWCEEGDATPLGTKGTVLGSMNAGEKLGLGYFIEWDNRPRVAVFTVAKKIGPERSVGE
jgi:hypothetical protein